MLDRHVLVKILGPKTLSKIITTFDRSTVVIVSACWTAAIMMLILTIYTVFSLSAAKRASDLALAVEPSLPNINKSPIDAPSAQTLIDRLKHRYPSVLFAIQNDQTLKVYSSDGSKFHEWLSSLSYIDTAYPNYHWSIQNLCVGKCRGELMNATLSAEKYSFSEPDKH